MDRQDEHDWGENLNRMFRRSDPTRKPFCSSCQPMARANPNSKPRSGERRLIDSVRNVISITATLSTSTSTSTTRSIFPLLYSLLSTLYSRTSPTACFTRLTHPSWGYASESVFRVRKFLFRITADKNCGGCYLSIAPCRFCLVHNVALEVARLRGAACR